MNLFYSSRIEGNSAYLTDEEHRHCSKVLRYKKGDQICCTNGMGIKYQTLIHQINKKDTELHIDIEHVIPKPHYNIHLGIAMPKRSNRLDFLIEKLVEIGIQDISPLITAHSERKKINTDRYRKKIISASTQSLKYHFPVLHEQTTFKAFLESQAKQHILVAHYAEENSSISLAAANQKSITVLIGPEGDFSPTELAKIQELGIEQVNLSKHRLRTETAAIVACTLLNETFF